VIVPVTPVGTGLRPAEVISVEPSGIPAGDAPEPDVMPSGDVAPIVGVGVTVPSNGMSACARATLQENSAARTTAVDTNLVGIFRLPTELRRQAPTSLIFATGTLAVRLSDIGQSLYRGEALGPSATADVQFLVERLIPFVLLGVEHRKSVLLGFARWRIWSKIFGSRLHLNGRCAVGRRSGERVCVDDHGV
jgi:hypothetical protein